jgi:hypothetical protein
MTVNTQELQKNDNTAGGFATANMRQAIYDEAELKYGPGFAQYCADVLTQDEESAEESIPQNGNMSDLIRLTSQLRALNQVRSADFFQAWGAEDKLYYMTLLADVSNDLSVALQGSLEISVRK